MQAHASNSSRNTAKPRWRSLRELIDRRELLLFLTWREIKVRYKQTILGGAWALLQPLLTMAIFTIVFGRLVGVDTGGVPYPIFALAALVPWFFIANSVSFGAASLTSNAHLLTKVYFPRALLPFSVAMSMLVDLVIATGLLTGIVLVTGSGPGVGLLALPAIILIALATAFGLSLGLSALSLRFRDVIYTVPFLVQIWLLASPVAYSSKIVPEAWKLAYALNPVTAVTEGFRWAFNAGPPPELNVVLVSGASALAMLILGATIFLTTERTMADVI